MTPFEYGIEFSKMGVLSTPLTEVPIADVYSAGVINRVLALAKVEGLDLAPTMEGALTDETTLLERMDRLATSRSDKALIYDSEVPAVLGIFRSTLDRIDNPPPSTVDFYTALPPVAMSILADSFHNYELSRHD